MEAKYITIWSCGTQILWIKHQLIDLDLSVKSVPIMFDNTSAISLSKYIVYHSMATHINIKNHFIHDHVDNDDFMLNFSNRKN